MDVGFDAHRKQCEGLRGRCDMDHAKRGGTHVVVLFSYIFHTDSSILFVVVVAQSVQSR